ncbi:ABC transporter ATP-binding protein [Mycolicibacterium neoaurum]|uniref:energy-coupling factor ABC transporter ATP-binding protein n=1 Tax=Mycolicibacterium neoaurum TaxID=1795 RepID=UPI00248B3D80|nr:ABC transporter ATP-binding protein [Mycolicibacterium neoaurum]WBP92746.1 ABC transporter ATP-binding protein [Mycolicibacterium neoaurum]WBS06308.1 ABC transporter ATP-binding protein [Mycolicibacterium neoaurum]
MPDEDTTAVLAVRDVGFAYPRGANVLTGVSLSIAAGQRIALLGANGSGKTTLQRILVGLTRPTSGSVVLDGADLTYARADRHRLRRSVQMVLQEPDDQIIGATVRADVSFGPANMGLTSEQVRSRVDQALSALGIADLADLPPHHLSFGQRKRVSVAGAVAMRPRVLLLDEATAGLDPKAVGDLLSTLAELAQNGTAVVLATHDVDVAWGWSRECILLDHGCARRGPTHDLLTDRAALATARLSEPWGAAISRHLGRVVLRPEDL